MLLSSVRPATGSDCASAAGSGFLNAINLFTGTSPESGGYLGNGGTVTDADGTVGTLGGVGVTGGLPTEVNVNSGLAIIGTGGFTLENAGYGHPKSTDSATPQARPPAPVPCRQKHEQRHAQERRDS